MTSKIGFFMFVGTVLGAIIGNIAFNGAGYGAIFGFVAGISIAVLLDWRDNR